MGREMEPVSSVWIQTRAGLAVDLLDPKPSQFSLLDIASSLSRLCRYTGHSRDHTSVAERTKVFVKQLGAAPLWSVAPPPVQWPRGSQTARAAT